ncbi:hypothetical protein CAEBREN_12276 [Caenorhabditis brenneri]|uniref:DUF7154 domain-containing protein n=1 Tax=Caenorhabditis brenneri TaxID=135651 RepID=G0N2F7_CAEBE|nr:hypothetical protein CAEBREN_12276 [Caenorhabditis brenneri]
MALDGSNLATHVSNSPFFANVSHLPKEAPRTSIDDCAIAVSCKEGSNLVVFDIDSATDFGAFGVDGFCDPYKQTWQVADDSGFKTFGRIYATCVTFRDPNDCYPGDPHTFLVAISNTFNAKYIKEFCEFLTNGLNSMYIETYAFVQFDMAVAQEIQYFQDFSPWFEKIENFSYNRTLAITDETVGSDVLNMIERFLDNTNAPVCGARMTIFLSDHPNETNLDRLVESLRKNHIAPRVISWESTVLSPNPRFQLGTIFRLCTLTNGLRQNGDPFFAFDLLNVGGGFLTYAANPLIVGNGSIVLPSMTPPHSASYFNVHFALLKDLTLGPDRRQFRIVFADTITSHYVQLNTSYDNPDGGFFPTGNYHRGLVSLSEGHVQNITLEYAIGPEPLQPMQIRIYSNQSVNYWVPYDN